ncbi:hypothetical protein PABY_24370 [Pyrodictium abyssi]|uniref:Uncharacterized protein n=1 Tax=Pyrodictium abyssi TaxID=54256 RepID=A0ABN6ZUV2_9CREN|nr:hypothetical protein PABY_24370 [Pyrodictium abyssi]
MYVWLSKRMKGRYAIHWTVEASMGVSIDGIIARMKLIGSVSPRFRIISITVETMMYVTLLLPKA